MGKVGMPRLPSAKRYAQAAFAIAQERGLIDRLGEELADIERALIGEDLMGVLSHAKVSLAQKEQMVRHALSGLSAIAQNLLLVLVKRRLLELAPQVRSEYQRLLDEHHGRARVQVVSAVELDAQEQGQVSAFVRGLVKKEVALDSRVDPAVLGGLFLRVGDRLVDASARGRLEELRKSLAGDSFRPQS